MHTLSGEPQDTLVVIVDDLVQTGGTLIQCAKGKMKSSAFSIAECVMHNACRQSRMHKNRRLE